jgi:hypothetical protein
LEKVSSDRTGRNAASRSAITNRFRSLSATAEGGDIPIAEPAPADPRAVEFIRFCYLRRRVSWPDLYDEMCMVAARGLFRGMLYEDLEEVGVSFTLGGMQSLARWTQCVVIEERARARASGIRPAPLPTDVPTTAPPHLAPVPG